MSTTRLISFGGRVLAVAALAACGAFVQAQTQNQPAQATQDAGANPAAAAAAQNAAEQAPKLNLQLPTDLTSGAAVSSSSSSSSSSENEIAANTTAPFKFADAMQYGGGRQRYGRPRYRGGNTNADGSPKYDFYGGGGFNMPVGDQTNYLSTSWGLQAGGGRMFDKHVGVNLEFDYDKFGMTGSTIRDQEDLYNYYIGLYNEQNPGNQVDPISGLNGNSHILSLALEPIYNLGSAAYVIGGVGFYHKVANFTVPAVGEYCDYYYGCYEYEADQIIDHYTSNAAGLNIGVGFTYKFSRFSSEKLYGEVRYVYIFNSPRPGVTLATATPDNANVLNDFPQNSNRTSYLPVKFGIRF